MCDLCETRKRVERADRVIRALRSGSPVNNEALASLLLELRGDLAARHNASALQQQMAQSLMAIMDELEGAPEAEDGATHCNPGSIN